MTYRTRIDLGVAAVVIAIGLVFAWQSWLIDPSSNEAVGPRSVPLFLATAMIVLGAGIGVASLAGERAGADDAVEDAEFGFLDSDLSRVVAVVGAGAAYTIAFWALGYMAATILAAAMALWIFGVRSALAIVVCAIVAGVAYQFVFMGLMGLLDPRGQLLDLRWLSRLITPGS